MKKKPWNILFVENSSDIGGANRSLLLILDNLDQSLFKPIVVCPDEGQMTSELASRSIPYRILSGVTPKKVWPFPFFNIVREYKKLLDVQKIDLVHVNDTAAYLWVGSALRKNPVPAICHVRFPYTYNDISYLAKITRRPDIFVYNSHSMEQELCSIADKYMPGVRRMTIQNAVDTDFFRPSDNKSYIKETFSISEDSPVVSIIANFTPMKDHETFLYVADRVRKEIPETIFMLAGSDVLFSGRREAELKSLAKELGLEKSVHFAGFVKEVNRVIQASDVIVSTSITEPFGRSIVEAMSCGKPVVASRVGGIPEIVSSDELGTLVEPGDVEGFATAVTEFLTKQNKRAHCGRNARRHIEDNFSTNAHMEKIHELYRNMLGESG